MAFSGAGAQLFGSSQLLWQAQLTLIGLMAMAHVLLMDGNSGARRWWMGLQLQADG